MAQATDAAGERQLVRIFISSPVDVRPERVIAERVIRRLDHEFSYHLRVEPYLWEREPLVASQSFQELIVRPSETDIVLVILWSRLGVLLDEAKFPGPLSGRAVTGTEWEFEDALKSARERRLPDLLLYRKTEKPKGEFGDRAEVEERQRQTELVEEFMRRWTRDADGKAFTAASWVFSDTTDFQQQLHQHLTELLRKRVAGAGEANPATIRWHHGSPYRGLEPFEREHEQVFFGRTRARHEVRELLGQHAADGTAFVLLVGASGSGKSSLVKAGLLPELSHPGMMGSAALVRWAITRPGTLHGSGSTSLMVIAGAILGDTALPELRHEPFHYTNDSLGALLGRSAAEATLPIRQGLGAAAAAGNLTARGEARLLLVVDQFEELFTTDTITPEMREQYVATLDAFASSGLVWVIATMRSDFFDRVAGVPALKRLVSNRTYVLAPPEGPEIGEIIRQPAREAGLSFEVDLQTGRSLDQEIQQAASRDPDSLPLLEYLLDQLWQRRTATGHLTFAAYNDLGGLEGAIGRRADAVLAAQDKDVQAAFTTVMRALVAGMQGKRAVARYALRAEFPKGSPEATLIRVFEDARLVVADGDRVRVSHEALLNHWPKARTQIEADVRDLELRARLEQAAERWQLATRKHRKSIVLGPGLPLIEAVALLRRWGGQLSPAVRNFIIASRRTLWRRRLKLSFGLAVAAAAVPALAGGLGGDGVVGRPLRRSRDGIRRHSPRLRPNGLAGDGGRERTGRTAAALGLRRRLSARQVRAHASAVAKGYDRAGQPLPLQGRGLTGRQARSVTRGECQLGRRTSLREADVTVRHAQLPAGDRARMGIRRAGAQRDRALLGQADRRRLWFRQYRRRQPQACVWRNVRRCRGLR